MSRAASAIKDVKILTREEIKNKNFDEVVEAYFALAELVFELQSIRDSQNGQILHLCVKTEELQTTIDNLKERIRLLISRKYGCKSESTRRFRSADLPEDIDDDIKGLLDAAGLLQGDGSGNANGPSNGDGNDGGRNEGKKGEKSPASGSGKGAGKGGSGNPEENNQDPNKSGDPSENGTPGTPEKKPKGNPHLKRTAGFKNRYLPDKPWVYEVDGSLYSEQELKDIMGITDDQLVYLRNTAYVDVKAEVIPAQYFNVAHIHPCARLEDDIMHLTGGISLIRNSVLSPSLMSHFMGMRYELCLPWNRMEKYLANDKVNFKRSTIIDWAGQTTDSCLVPVCRRLKRLLLKRHSIQADETFVTVINDDREGSHNSYFWQFRTSEYEKDQPTIIVFIFDKTREERVVADFLKDFEGYLMTDAYVCYKTLSDNNSCIISCLCWQHMRRLFWDVLRAYPNFFRLSKNDRARIPAWQIVERINAIYAAEKEVKALLQTDPDRAKLFRDTIVRSAVDACFEAIKALKADEKVYCKGSLLAKAIDYALNGEERFRNFLNSTAVPLDNQASERSMISVSVLRNNIKLIDSLYGAQREAIGFSIYETAKAADANPELYFKYIYEMMPKIIEDHWAEIQDENNELDFFDCMMPWSEEFKAYVAQQSNAYQFVIAEALTRYNLFSRCPIDSKYLARIIENKKNGLEKLGKYLDELKKCPENPECYQSRVKGMIIPQWVGPEYYLHTACASPQEESCEEAAGDGCSGPSGDPPDAFAGQPPLAGTA